MDFEQELIRVVQSYRNQGYSVVPRPRPEDLPLFAKDFQLEIVGRRGNEGVLVAVKKNRDEVAADGNMQRYAETTGSQPGWRFDFAILEPENPKARDIRGASELSGEDFSRSLDQAVKLSAMGFSRVAVVAAWAALEAAMRTQLRALGQEAGWGSAPRQMLRELYSEGILSPEEFNQLELASYLRNQIVHGFSSQPAESEAGQAEVVRFLSEIARRLVSRSQQETQPA
jgi:HEPN domain-containing protein